MPPCCDPVPFVEVRKAYRDRKAFEESTKKTKKKFRLAGDSVIDLGVFPFFFVYGEIAALIKTITLIVKREDWKDRIPDELDHDESYIDISHIEALTREQIRIKRDDPENGFAPVATLSNNKFLKLKRMAKNLRIPDVGCRVSRETKQLICHGLAVGEGLRRKLGL